MPTRHDVCSCFTWLRVNQHVILSKGEVNDESVHFVHPSVRQSVTQRDRRYVVVVLCVVACVCVCVCDGGVCACVCQSVGTTFTKPTLGSGSIVMGVKNTMSGSIRTIISSGVRGPVPSASRELAHACTENGLGVGCVCVCMCVCVCTCVCVYACGGSVRIMRPQRSRRAETDSDVVLVRELKLLCFLERRSEEKFGFWVRCSHDQRLGRDLFFVVVHEVVLRLCTCVCVCVCVCVWQRKAV
jgi:hypothetical protein